MCIARLVMSATTLQNMYGKLRTSHVPVHLVGGSVPVAEPRWQKILDYYMQNTWNLHENLRQLAGIGGEQVTHQGILAHEPDVSLHLGSKGLVEECSLKVAPRLAGQVLACAVKRDVMVADNCRHIGGRLEGRWPAHFADPPSSLVPDGDNIPTQPVPLATPWYQSKWHFDGQCTDWAATGSSAWRLAVSWGREACFD